MDIQNNSAIIFLKTLSYDFSTSLQGTDLTQETREWRIASVAFRSLGALVALSAVPLAAKTVVALATGGLILSSVGLIATLFHIILAHDLIQTGQNCRPVDNVESFLKTLKNIGSNEVEIALKDTIAFYPMYLILEGKS